MNVLMLGPLSREAELTDIDYARCLEIYGGAFVSRLDPGQMYRLAGMRGVELEIIRILNQHNIQLVLYWLGPEFDLRPEFLTRELASQYRILILGDDEHYFDVSHRYYAQCFDLVLTNNPLCERFHLYGIDALFLPNVFSPKLFCPAVNSKKDIDVSFVGAMRGKKSRDVFSQALRDAGIALHLYGSGTEAGMVTKEDVIDIYRRSKINLNFTGSSVATPLDGHLSINRRVRQVKGRNTKIALCGSFVLSEYAAGLERLFEIGSEIAVFDDPDELVQKVRYFLAHHDIREQMAARAHARALRQYDEAIFWPRIIHTILERMAKRRRRMEVHLAIDKPFRRAYSGWRFRYLAFYFLSGKWRLFASELCRLWRSGRWNWRVAIWAAYYGLSDAAAAGGYLAIQIHRLLGLIRGRRPGT